MKLFGYPAFGLAPHFHDGVSMSSIEGMAQPSNTIDLLDHVTRHAISIAIYRILSTIHVNFIHKDSLW
jgi:hypothetical protein